MTGFKQGDRVRLIGTDLEGKIGQLATAGRELIWFDSGEWGYFNPSRLELVTPAPPPEPEGVRAVFDRNRYLWQRRPLGRWHTDTFYEAVEWPDLVARFGPVTLLHEGETLG